MTETPREVPVTSGKPALAKRISLVWVVPILALIIALGVAWHNYADRGPEIRIAFDNAEGVKAGETELRYRDVAVGVVDNVAFSKGLQKVIVTVRLDKDVAPYVDKDASFWVVRPQVTTRGVTGLGTVLSGVFIQGLWDSKIDQTTTSFQGLSDAPLNSDGKPGLRIKLKAATDAGLTGNTVIEYRGIEVGRIGKAQVADDGATVEADAIIFAPQDKLITSATRFWDTSGFSFNLGPNGASLNISSVATLLQGGVTFQTVASGGQEVKPDTTFTVYPDEDSARASAFGENQGPAVTVTAYFRENVQGLSVDAPVTFGGLRVGRVDSISGIINKKRFGDDDVHLAATLQLRPSTMGIDDKDGQKTLQYLADRVAKDHLRARLVTASVLTGGLKVDLTSMPDTPDAKMDLTGDPNPIIPTGPGSITDVSASAQGILNRISSLPIEELMNSAIDTLNNISSLAGNDQTKAIPGEISQTLDAARKLVTSDKVQDLPDQLASVAGNINGLLEEIQRQQTVEKINQAIDNVSQAAGNIGGAVSGVPDLVQRLDNIGAKVQDMPLDKLSNSLDQLMQTVNDFLAEADTKALPAHLSQTLDQLSATLKDLRDSGAIANLNGALSSANDAAQDVSDASRNLPQLIDQAQTIMSQASNTLKGYDARNGVGRDLTDTLRQVQRAADAISALARELQRNPNSLLFGR